MAIADLLKRRTGHTSHTTTPVGVTATSPVVTGGHTGHTSHTTKNKETEHEPPNPLAKSAESAAPAHEIERIITVLVNEVSRDLGPELIDLMRRAMRSMDRETRANLTAEIDDAFEQAVSVREAREQASLAIRSRVGKQDPSNADEWLVWIAERCPLLPEDSRFVGLKLALMTPAKMATAAHWYAQAWAKAADAEQLPHKKDNAGRRAANATLLQTTSASLPTATTRASNRTSTNCSRSTSLSK